MDRKGGTDFCIKDFYIKPSEAHFHGSKQPSMDVLKRICSKFLKKLVSRKTMVAFIFCVTKGVILGIFRNIQNSYSVENLLNL